MADLVASDVSGALPESSGPPSLSLRVGEARPKDSGRGIARLDPQDMKRLGVKIGDVVAVTGKRTVPLKVVPVYPEDRGNELMQIDGIARENAGVGIDERVTVKSASVESARVVALEPLGPSRLSKQARDASYIGRLVDGLVVQAGDRVRVNLFGSRPQDFKVTNTSPGGFVLVQEGTRVKVDTGADGAAAARNGVSVSYEDVGGLGRTLARLREMIELPLRFPEVFDRLGIDPPKGVLLYGPPGCGKTLIARAVAHETSAHFIHVNGPEIMAKFYGESEANLRKIFQEAEKNAPSIVFLDELDAIAPKRSEVQGEVEKRVVAQMLSLLDGVTSRGQVIVMGATNIPDNIDPALRRPGRLDREIEIPIPDRHGRRQILEIHTRGMPLDNSVDIEYLASVTHGYVGADLAALGREAAMIALRRIIPSIDLAAAEIPYEELLALTVGAPDFETALREVEPSMIREFFIEVPDTRWSDIGGLESVKQHLRETIEWPQIHEGLFAHAGAAPPKGILLIGPPGCGKTLMAKAVAHESNANFISVKGPELVSKWVGESEKGVREVFKKARQAAPCIVFLDEIDVMAARRGSSSGERVTERMLGQILTELDGIEELRGVTVLGATNRLDVVDPALTRPGRFDLIVEIAPPDTADRRAILDVHTRKGVLDRKINLDSLAERTEGFVGADLAELCREATMGAIREFVAADTKPALSAFKVTPAHFEKALTSLNQKPQNA
ncbi:MAG: CDC48 family AAA ATPase [Candidatus Nanopelagicales bacterium]|nr:CDC48 family AAA ATPase [Candidatus Nanopelagicales bacterium]MDZ4249148.1 CDC48 family AAA ATPase [Candidatus Nanopelagicales bacterium]MDZ7577488.1 CDC48 family AAA ATPase [Candidatus Nanopelagicales bacterium]